MKQYFILPDNNLPGRYKVSGLINFSLVVAIFLLLATPYLGSAQQYVKTYKAHSPCSQAIGNLEFNCITKTKWATPSYFVAGLQDTSVYVAEVDANGVVLQEKLIGVRSRNYSLRSMITDEDGNIVIVGSATNSYPFVAFMMKISSSLSLIMHRTYNNLNLTSLSQMQFMDVKDAKSENSYYVSGTLRLYSNIGGADALLLRMDRNTGAILASNKTNTGQEDGYDAFVFGIGKIGNDPLPAILATGRFSPKSSFTMRPWLNKHNNALSFSSGTTHIRPMTTAARLYSSSLLLDNKGSTVLYCWHGQLNGTASIGVNVGLAAYTESNLATVWQNEYVFSPRTSTYKFLNKIAGDKGGYVAEGNWWDGSTYGQGGGPVGEMILLRTDKNGTPIWSRKINNVLVNQQTHNAAFLIDGNSIFAVGKKAGSTINSSFGVLVRLPLVDGAMDTSCAPLMTTKVIPLNYNVPAQATNLTVEFKDSTLYNPINCTGTDTITNCNEPCTDTTQLNADFNLYGGLLAGNNTSFVVLANGFTTTPNSQWIVSRTTTNATNSPDLAGTVYASTVGSGWAIASGGTQFGGYIGSSILSGSEVNTPSASFFIANRYRFRHILSTTNNCGITKTDTVVKTVSMCPGCKVTNGGNGLVVETEKASASGQSRSGVATLQVTEPGNTSLRVMPNPASTGTISIEYANAAPGAVFISIADMQGKKVAAKQFTTSAKSMNKYAMDVSTLANGMYTISILNNGKTAVQKIVVAK